MQLTTTTQTDSPDTSSMRRVLMLTYSFPPTATAGVFRTIRFTKYLPESGWEPIVLSVDPEAVGRGTDESLLEQVPDGLEVVRTGVDAPDEKLKRLLGRGKKTGTSSSGSKNASPDASESKPTRARPWWNPKTWVRNTWEFAFETPDEKIWWKKPAWRAAAEIIQRRRPEVIYSTGPPHSTHLIAAVLSKRTGIPLVIDFRDPWARAPWRATERNPWGCKLLGRYERKVVRQASRVVLNTQRLADQFARVYPKHAHKFDVITNGFDPTQLDEVSDYLPDGARDSSRAITLCHPGSLYNQRDPRPLLQAVKRLSGSGTKVCFEQIGQFDSNFNLTSYADNPSNAEHFRLFARMPHGEALQHMGQADVLVLLQPGTDLQIPGKLYEMIMFGKPILTLADDGATADIINKYRLGVVASPSNVDEICTAVEQLVRRVNNGNDEGNWPEALREFDGRRLTARLAKSLTMAIESRTS